MKKRFSSLILGALAASASPSSAAPYRECERFEFKQYDLGKCEGAIGDALSVRGGAYEQ
jgi:hypothetical protein